MSPTLSVNLTLFIILLQKEFGHYRFIMLQSMPLTKQLSILISIIHDNISSQKCQDAKYFNNGGTTYHYVGNVNVGNIREYSWIIVNSPTEHSCGSK